MKCRYMNRGLVLSHKVLCLLLSCSLLLQVGCHSTRVLQTLEWREQKTDEHKYPEVAPGQFIRITYKRSEKSAKRLDVTARVKYVTSDAIVVAHNRAEFQVPFDVIEKIEVVDKKNLTPHELTSVEQMSLKPGLLLRVTIIGLYKGLYKRSEPLVGRVKSVTSDAVVVTHNGHQTRILFKHIQKIGVVDETKIFTGQLLRVTIIGLYKGLYKRSEPLVGRVKFVMLDAIVLTDKDEDIRISFEHIKKIEWLKKEPRIVIPFVLSTTLTGLVFFVLSLIAYAQLVSE